MTAELIRREYIAARGNAGYDNHIRALVETEENIGKMLIRDVVSGDYEIDEMNILTAHEKLAITRPELNGKTS